MEKERIEVFKDYLRQWDFEMFPLMPVNKDDAQYLLYLFDQIDKIRVRKHEYYMKNREEKLRKAKEQYHKDKAKLIKGAK